jgi:hypothetical protein
VGCVTDQCVAHTVKDACDLGYLVTLVTGVRGIGQRIGHVTLLRVLRHYTGQPDSEVSKSVAAAGSCFMVCRALWQAELCVVGQLSHSSLLRFRLQHM